MPLLRKLLLFFYGSIIVFAPQEFAAHSAWPGESAIKVMSYNIRYDNPGDEENAWPRRAWRVVDLIKSTKPDLIGIQEALHGQLIDMEEGLPEYAWFGVGRDDGKTKGEYSPVLYRKERFDVLDGGTFWLSETPEDTGSVGWDAAITRIVTWLELNDRTANQELFFFNTHFDHRGEVARKESARLLVSRVKSIAKSSSAVVSGDFNFEDVSEAYQILTTSDPKHPGQALRDAFKISEREGSQVGTCCGFNVQDSHAKRIDYIFVGGRFSSSSYSVLTNHLNGRYPSDHLPVVAEVGF
jgi:endonuclease/exonuclease/phosphatase family metal-dependent hydrolase